MIDDELVKVPRLDGVDRELEFSLLNLELRRNGLPLSFAGRKTFLERDLGSLDILRERFLFCSLFRLLLGSERTSPDNSQGNGRNQPASTVHEANPPFRRSRHIDQQ